MLNQFIENLFSFTTSRDFYVAYSGGLDSTVLLHLMFTIKKYHPDIKLHAVHVNHGLSANADAWALHCQSVCQLFVVDLSVIKVDVKSAKKKGESQEAVARNMRYGVFKNILEQDQCLLTAHHRDDQAETLLLQLLRGAGPKGLSAMPSTTQLGKGRLIRPMLGITREFIKKYADDNHLKWIDDETNYNTCFDRNYIRHELLPLMQQRWPSLSKTLSRVAIHCAETTQLLEEVIDEDLEKVMNRERQTLWISQLSAFSKVRQSHIIRRWLQQLQFSLPSTAKLNQIQCELLNSRVDAQPLVTWDDIEVRRYRDEMYVMRKKDQQSAPDLLLMEALLKQNGFVIPENASVTIKFRHDKKTCQLPGRKGTRTLKKLFQEWGVPPWIRDRVLLIFIDDQLIGIWDWVLNRVFTPLVGRSTHRPRWK